MARGAPVAAPTHRCYFIDTSYLCELYAVPDFCDPRSVQEIRARYAAARLRADRLFVPMGCLLELGNHIADIKNAPQRQKWADALLAEVRMAMDVNARLPPYKLIDAPPLRVVTELVETWCQQHVASPRGLVDAATAIEAVRFKRERAMGALVHIWTLDRRLKGVEPDPEPDPYVRRP